MPNYASPLCTACQNPSAHPKIGQKQTQKTNHCKQKK